MDIIICRIKYPNDPTGNANVHQHFIGSFEGSTLELYSISSIIGKAYILKISEDVDISKLNGRVIPIDIREKIADKISLMKENKKLKRYCIDMNEFISINNKVKK